MEATLNIETTLAFYAKQLAEMAIAEFRKLLSSEKLKDWYTTEELADALGKKRWTIQEKWCNAGRIECEKDESGKWRIPGHEYQRLTNGGGLRPLNEVRQFSA